MPTFYSSGDVSTSRRQLCAHRRLRRAARVRDPADRVAVERTADRTYRVGSEPKLPRPGVIEVEIAGAQLRLRGVVDEAMLVSMNE